MPFGDPASFDPAMFGDLGGGDIFSGDPSWPGDNFAFGDTSDSSNMLGSNDPYITDPNSMSGSPFEVPSGLGNAMSGMGNGLNFGGVPWAQIIQTLGGLSGFMTGQEGISMTKDQIQRSDPWGYSGGRAEAGDKLKQMMDDPRGSVAGMPNFQAGMEAVERSGASRGFLGSGNMETDLLKYGGDMWQQMFNDYAGISGAKVDPGHNAPQLMGVLGQAEAGKNASIGNIINGIGGALARSSGAPAAQPQRQQSSGGGDSGFMSDLGGIASLAMAFL